MRGAHPKRLSPRVREALDLLLEGRTNADIAATMGVTTETIKTYVTQMFNLTGMGTRTELCAYFHQKEVDALKEEIARLKG